MRRPLIAAAVIALALPLLAACGSSGASSGAAASGTSNAPAPGATPGPANCAALAGVPAFPGTWGTGPEIPKGTGKPPKTLKTEDCRVGTGAAVTDTGLEYNWNYTGTIYPTGAVFDSSFARGAPTAFALNQVIPGWTKGLLGMKVGGRRLLVIPPDQAYGAKGNPPTIPANSTLVFVVDLVGPVS